jgi:rSAM/selenodomain-associated transferase 2
MTISIVIPALNEAAQIAGLIYFLKKNGTAALKEVIVVDGGSHDNTLRAAKEAGAMVVQSPVSGRAPQMNYGASLANGEVLYFVHADTFPASNFATDILRAINDGFDLGRYRTKFLSDKWLLRLNAWFTRFDLFVGMGGDQTLFIRKNLFDELGGFNEALVLMEDFEFCERAREKGKYKILNGEALVSARKYEKNSWLQVQLANAKIVSLYKQGASQQQMVEEYKRRLKW